MVQAIILDYDGVIRFADVEKTSEVLESQGFEHKEFFKKLWENDLVQDLIVGKIDRKTWWSQLQNLHPELNRVDHEFLWDEVFAFPIINHDLLEAVQEKKKRYGLKTAILSNADGGSTKIIQDQMSKYQFDEIFSSSGFGIAKPDPEIYHKTLEVLKCPPEDAIFFDDSEKNIVSANDIGMNAFLYKDLTHFNKVVDNLIESISS